MRFDFWKAAQRFLSLTVTVVGTPLTIESCSKNTLTVVIFVFNILPCLLMKQHFAPSLKKGAVAN